MNVSKKQQLKATSLLRCLGALLIAGLLAACGSTPPLPEDNLYDLHQAQGIAALDTPLFDGQIVVRAPRAVGARGERGVVYAAAEGDSSLRQYHYHQWIDAPPVLLQRRLIVSLRDANVATLVSDRAAERMPSLVISGHLDRFDRARSNDRWSASVAWEIRVDHGQGRGQPILLKTYRRDLDAADNSMPASARAFSAAVDDILREFVTDLEAALAE